MAISKQPRLEQNMTQHWILRSGILVQCLGTVETSTGRFKVIYSFYGNMAHSSLVTVAEHHSTPGPLAVVKFATVSSRNQIVA